MKFSTRSTYGLRAMIKLAKNWGKGSISLANIAKTENISLGYLERIFSKLKGAGLVESTKGASGGYKLVKNPSSINILDIIEVLEGREGLFHCMVEKKGKTYCSEKCDCKGTMALEKIQEAINASLKNIKLNNLL